MFSEKRHSLIVQLNLITTSLSILTILIRCYYSVTDYGYIGQWLYWPLRVVISILKTSHILALKISP